MDKELVLEQLRLVYDPELGVNVVDLGLIYDMEQTDDGKLTITMTLTTPGCPMHDTIAGGVERAVIGLPGVKSVQVDVVWSPPWTPDKMSDEAKEQLSFF
jgi:metal-sulfur cluster biosynthetic enzyme